MTNGAGSRPEEGACASSGERSGALLTGMARSPFPFSAKMMVVARLLRGEPTITCQLSTRAVSCSSPREVLSFRVGTAAPPCGPRTHGSAALFDDSVTLSCTTVAPAAAPVLYVPAISRLDAFDRPQQESVDCRAIPATDLHRLRC
jgi:hypothetical protein